MVTKELNKITQNETQDLQLVDNFCKSWVIAAFKGWVRVSKTILYNLNLLRVQ